MQSPDDTPVLILTGPPGAGKTTAARVLAGRSARAVHVESDRFFFEPLRDALREAGHEVAYAVLRAPLDVCVARTRSRDSQPLADPVVVERLWHDFADLGPLSPHAVDFDAEDPKAAADLLAVRIRDGSLRA